MALRSVSTLFWLQPTSSAVGTPPVHACTPAGVPVFLRPPLCLCAKHAPLHGAHRARHPALPANHPHCLPAMPALLACPPVRLTRLTICSNEPPPDDAGPSDVDEDYSVNKQRSQRTRKAVTGDFAAKGSPLHPVEMSTAATEWWQTKLLTQDQVPSLPTPIPGPPPTTIPTAP